MQMQFEENIVERIKRKIIGYIGRILVIISIVAIVGNLPLSSLFHPLLWMLMIEIGILGYILILEGNGIDS